MSTSTLSMSPTPPSSLPQMPTMMIVGGQPAEFVGVYEILEGTHSREENGETVTYCPASRQRQFKADNEGKRIKMGGHLIQLTAAEVRFLRVLGKHRFQTVKLYSNGAGMEMEAGSPVDLGADFTGASSADLISVIATTTDVNLLDLMLKAEQAERNRADVIEFIRFRKLAVAGVGN